MISMRLLSIVFIGLIFSANGYAETPVDHSAHHSAADAAPANATTMGDSAGPMARMDAQLKLMHDMHVKMAAAKTPAERQALLAEHMKTMQQGMDMMSEMMAKDDMSAMKGMMANGDKGAMKGMSGMDKSDDGKAPMAMHHDMMKMHHKMMKKHMQMMHAMMQMMIDALPQTSAGS